MKEFKFFQNKPVPTNDVLERLDEMLETLRRNPLNHYTYYDEQWTPRRKSFKWTTEDESPHEFRLETFFGEIRDFKSYYEQQIDFYEQPGNNETIFSDACIHSMQIIGSHIIYRIGNPMFNTGDIMVEIKYKVYTID